MRIAFLSVIGALALAGCQTARLDRPNITNVETPKAASQSERLVKLADEIDARGESDTALALYERAVAMPDAKPAAFVKAGGAYMKAGYPAEAVKAYRAALAKDPNDGQAMLGLGSAMIETGDARAGLRALEQAAPLVNTSSGYNRLGVAQTFAGRLDEAQETFAQALELAPGDLDIETNMALAAALDGNSAVAIPLIQQVSRSSDAQMHHKRNAVVVYGLLGQAAGVKAAPPTGLTSKEVNTLLARAKSIRAESSVQAKAKALGSFLG